MQQSALDGSIQVYTDNDTFTEGTICCFTILDLNLYDSLVANTTNPRTELAGPIQDYTCRIQPVLESDSIDIEMTIGLQNCCVINGTSSRLVVDINSTGVCDNTSIESQTAVILTTEYYNGSSSTAGNETFSVTNDTAPFTISNFTRVDLHYQVCGNDTLSFSLPIAGKVH